MSVQQFHVCDCCERVIGKDDAGVTIKGNLYRSDVSEKRKELFGNNFPAIRGMAYRYEEVKESHVCIECLLSTLAIEPMRLSNYLDKTRALNARVA